MTRFQLQAHLDDLWRERPSAGQPTREQVKSLLGLAQREGPPAAAEKLRTIDCGSYWEEKYSLSVGEGVQSPIYLLIPKTDPPYTAVLAFHGHDPSVQYILGHYPDEEMAVVQRGNDNNYAEALAQAGYLVCAVEQRGMGERLTVQTGEPPLNRSCRHLAFSYMLHGRTLLGERCWDGICALNYLQTRPDVRPGLFGCTGHSGGGTTALFLALLDERLTAVVVSGYFCSFQASILGLPHCECNYVPGILQLGEMGDLAALVAPRPLCLVNGRYDPIFPIAGTEAQFETVRHAYAANGRAEACQLTIHEGEHAYYLPAALAWFQTWLNEA